MSIEAAIEKEMAAALGPILAKFNLSNEAEATAVYLRTRLFPGTVSEPGEPGRVSRRKLGRPAKASKASAQPSKPALKKPRAAKKAHGGSGPQPAAQAAACAIIGCHRPAKALGYCINHYMKFRNLKATGRLPPSWKEHAAPQSVENIKLPRGRTPKA